VSRRNRPEFEREKTQRPSEARATVFAWFKSRPAHYHFLLPRVSSLVVTRCGNRSVVKTWGKTARHSLRSCRVNRAPPARGCSASTVLLPRGLLKSPNRRS